MNEPVSMLDWGLDQLQRSTQDTLNSKSQDLGFPPGQMYVGAGYDFAKNEIDITITTNLYARPQPKDVCRNLVNWLRDQLAPQAPATKKRFIFWGMLFQHSGFTNSQKSEQGLGDKLAKLVVVAAQVAPQVNTGKLVFCSGPLLGESVNFEE